MKRVGGWWLVVGSERSEAMALPVLRFAFSTNDQRPTTNARSVDFTGGAL
jgi:hypothetical protein